jgi:uncharacterized protein YwgA
MTAREDIVVAVITAAPERKLTSRVRLQKTVYLLDQLKFGSGFKFEYHHYGPYSRELDGATADAQALRLVNEVVARRVSDGAAYSIFEAAQADPKVQAYGKLGRSSASELISRFANTNVTVLELAATIDWLWRMEKIKDWRAEVGKRKSAKVGGGRLEKAIELLHAIGLRPPPLHGSARAA